jgi:hypothetical protein
MRNQNPSHQNPTKRAVQGLEALGTPSAKERKHHRVEVKADVPPKKGDEVQPIRHAQPRAIRLPKIGGR